MKRWILVDYDSTGLLQVQARDEHPLRQDDTTGAWFDDDAAIALCRQEAEAGDAEAIQAIEAHDRDTSKIDALHAARAAQGIL